MPVRQSYCDRVFTTSIVSYPELVHIGADKDFTPVIERAIQCGGYEEDKYMTGMNGGHTVTILTQPDLPITLCCLSQRN